ncbi:hypothetical protein Tco_0300709 [Tanacetum coccineum]
MPNPNPSLSSFLKDCTVHILYTNAKTFADVVLPNHVGDEELNSIDGAGIGVLTKAKIKKDENGVPKKPKWKLNDKAVPHNEEVYHYLWHPTEIPHLNRIIKDFIKLFGIIAALIKVTTAQEERKSLNVTFDVTPPPSKTSPMLDDDLDEEKEEEEAIKVSEEKNIEND